MILSIVEQIAVFTIFIILGLLLQKTLELHNQVMKYV